MNVENMHLIQGTWPDVLTPELRQQLLLDKIARAKQATEQRKAYPSPIRAELNIECCHEQECEHH
jgi:hypothetical protein